MNIRLWFKKRQALRIQKRIEAVTNNLLHTPNISYKSQVAMIEAAQELFREEVSNIL